MELICLRAFDDKSGKIFVVMNADNMDFDCGVHIEGLFRTHEVKNKDYRLIFVVSKERGDRSSYIATAFDKYAVTLPNLETTADECGRYLLRHLSVGRGASRHDPDGSRFRLVSSNQSGNGKSLFCHRIKQRNEAAGGISTTLQIQEISYTEIIAHWTHGHVPSMATVHHLDISMNVDSGRNDLLFSLAVLGGLVDSRGAVWLCGDSDLYLIEVTLAELADLKIAENRNQRGAADRRKQAFSLALPLVICKPPRETYELIKAHPSFDGQDVVRADDGRWTRGFDSAVYRSEKIQRPISYLTLYKMGGGRELDRFRFLPGNEYDIGHICEAMQTLLHYCPVAAPTFAELLHFSSFLNVCLETTEHSVFCDPSLVGEELPGFKSVVCDFLIMMSQDFASRSIEVSDQSHGDDFSRPAIVDRRRWETAAHPYVFFNQDGVTISFFGLHLVKGERGYDLVDERTKAPLKRGIMGRQLYEGLRRQGVVFNRTFDEQSRAEKLAGLCQVFGVEENDPDETYELTYDNCLKMLSTQCRFRANIPVVMMGETGSGKTRLVKFMTSLQRGRAKDVANMLILKIHGGTTSDDINRTVQKAIAAARRNSAVGVKPTVVFFDEANTTQGPNSILFYT